MAKDQSDFFKEKKPWSEVKDELLEWYLRPYFQKVLRTGKPVRYIDCFAGRGDFDDGKPGSPLIALDAAREAVIATKGENTDLALTFIEARWSAALEAKAATHEAGKHRRMPFSVVKGRFERDTRRLMSGMRRQNVFLYIDPYGVRDLDHGLIASFADAALDLRSIELLINLNSFGFLRAGCKAMRVLYQDDDALHDDDEFAEEWDPTAKPVETLNGIAGGDYWQAVVDAFKRKEIDGFKAELRFSALYRAKLGETYRYVLSMPIRLNDRQHPKYRMIFATNHADGCILMADNMMERTANLAIHLDSYQQGTLFDEGVDGEITDESQVRAHVQAIADRLVDYALAEDVVAEFYSRAGVVCKPGVVRAALAQLEKDGDIEVRRDPAFTPTGKPSTFFTTERRRGRQTVMIGAKRGRPIR